MAASVGLKINHSTMIKYFLFIFLMAITVSSASYSKELIPDGHKREPVTFSYAIALYPAPVLNTPDFSSIFGGKDGKTLKLNKKGIITEVEFVALPKTVFTIEEAIKKNGHEILKVRTEDYPYPTSKGYYIDSRFVEKRGTKPPEREKRLLPRDTIIKNLKKSKGAIYVWGGNYVKGIPQMLDFYKPSGRVSKAVRERWILKGVDCSGLLYEATNGYIPRNTESLVYFGKSVEVKGLGVNEIAEKLKPLDIIVWKKHAVIVLDSEHTIESRVGYGVRIRNLRDVLTELLKKMTPSDAYAEGDKKFVIRRWYPPGYD